MDLTAFLARIDVAWLLSTLVWIVVILVLTVLALRIAPRITSGIIGRALAEPEAEDTKARLTALEAVKRRRTLESLASNIVRGVILLISTFAILGVLRVDLGPAIAGFGLLGLGVGLGLQYLVKDIVAGVFILFENQYARGDVVTIADVTGTVEVLGLRRTILRDADGTVHNVANGLIGVASNHTRRWGRALVEVPFKDAALVDEAHAAATNALRSMSEDPEWSRRFLEPPRIDGVKWLASTGVVLQVSASVAASERTRVAAEVRRRVLLAFKEAEIALGDPAPPNAPVIR